MPPDESKARAEAEFDAWKGRQPHAWWQNDEGNSKALVAQYAYLAARRAAQSEVDEARRERDRIALDAAEAHDEANKLRAELGKAQDRIERLWDRRHELGDLLDNAAHALPEGYEVDSEHSLADRIRGLWRAVESAQFVALQTSTPLPAAERAVVEAAGRQLYECELRGRDAKEYRAACKATDFAAYALRALQPKPDPVREARGYIDRAKALAGAALKSKSHAAFTLNDLLGQLDMADAVLADISAQTEGKAT